MPTADSRGLMAARATCSKPINIAVMSASISRAEDPKTSLICTRASARASFAGPRIVVVPIPWRTRKRRTQILLLGANLQLYLDDRLELLPANERVTDGTRTRALRSHNPMLYQLSYGHHAQGDSTSEKARSKRNARRM